MIKGVVSVQSGFAGGTVPHPTYEQVCMGATGHAETVEVEFDPAVISYQDILEVFFAIHDPTTLNRQGNDVGTEYRSVIFFTNTGQEATAKKILAEVNGPEHYNGKVVTDLKPLEAFYVAEDYHQDYYNNYKNRNPYCTFVISPKIKKFKEKFSFLLR